MSKIFMVWERECFDNYDVIFVTDSKDKALNFILELTGETYDPNGEIGNGNIRNYHVVDFERFVGEYNSRVSSEVYIEERELDQYEPLSI